MNYIVIADTHALYRQALCDYITHAAGNEFSVAGFADYNSMMGRDGGFTPELMILSSELSDMDDFMKAGADKIAVMVPGNEDAGHWLDDAENIAGIFPKSLSCKMFLSGVREILAGHKFFPEEDHHAFSLQGPHPYLQEPEDFGLTMREKEVLSYLVKGQSNKDIARALDLQVVTVKLHVRGVCRKLGAANRTQAALIGKEGGWK